MVLQREKEEMFPLTHQSEGSASLQRRNRAQTSSQSRGSACYRLLLSDQTGEDREGGRENQHHTDQFVQLVRGKTKKQQ